MVACQIFNESGLQLCMLPLCSFVILRFVPCVQVICKSEAAMYGG